MIRSSRRRHKPTTWFWVALIGILLVLNAGLAYVWLSGILMPTATPQPTRSATPKPTLEATPSVPRQPQRTAMARIATPTRGPTRTPRPRPSIIPSPTGPRPVTTPGVEVARCQDAGGHILDDTFVSQTSGTEQSYIVYLPPCYDVAVRRYPTIYLIHGAYHDDTHWESLGIFDAMDKGIREGRFAPAIIVLPSGDDELFTYTSGGEASYEEQIVRDLVPTVDRLFRTDAQPKMRAIGGISRGGVWSLEIGFSDPTLFGAVAGHSPCLNLNESPPEYDPLKMTLLPTLKSQRIWLDAGDADDCLPGTEELHAALDAAGVSHYYRVYPGIHEDAFWAAHLDDYLAFYGENWPK